MVGKHLVRQNAEDSRPTTGKHGLAVGDRGMGSCVHTGDYDHSLPASHNLVEDMLNRGQADDVPQLER